MADVLGARDDDPLELRSRIGLPSVIGDSPEMMQLITMQRCAEQLFFEGNRLLAARDHEHAEACFRKAVSIAPRLTEAHANLGWLLEQRHRNDEAEASYRHALRLDPSRTQIHLNFGAFLARLKRFPDAETAYLRAIELDSNSAPAWSNLGALYAQMARFEQAEACCRRSLALDPGYDKAHVNLSHLCLRKGDFEAGWFHRQWRTTPYALERLVACPRWSGESLQGRSLLIGPECGHGDVIQFCRYAQLLKRRGALRIALICHPALKTLLSRADGIDEVLSFEDPVPRQGWDFWAPILSLPYHCATRIDSVPAALPYLRAHRPDVSRWKSILPSAPVRVGLVWQGNRHFSNDDERSIHQLDVLETLGGIDGIRFISLQVGSDEDEARLAGSRLQLQQLPRRIESFADTAAIVTSLDLVISVDTAVAHLAGALGKSCWVLLPYHMTDWRWLDGRIDSPWYPVVMRLFRQPRRGDWHSVVQQVRFALEELSRQRITCCASASPQRGGKSYRRPRPVPANSSSR